MALFEYRLGSLDVTERVLDDAKVSIGRSQPGSAVTEIRAGLSEIILDNNDGFFTSGNGSYLLVPGNADLSIAVDGRDLIVGSHLTNYNVIASDQYSRIECEYSHTLYLITTASDIGLNFIGGNLNDVLSSLIGMINNNITLSVNAASSSLRVIVKTTSAYSALTTLLQSENLALLERTHWGQLSIVHSGKSPSHAGQRIYNMYDNEGSPYLEPHIVNFREWMNWRRAYRG